jgi:hypothetical protein
LAFMRLSAFPDGMKRYYGSLRQMPILLILMTFAFPNFTLANGILLGRVDEFDQA